jgi:hypothetical protein
VEDPVQEGVIRWICGATYFYAHPEELAGRRTRSVSEPIAVFRGARRDRGDPAWNQSARLLRGLLRVTEKQKARISASLCFVWCPAPDER